MMNKKILALTSNQKSHLLRGMPSGKLGIFHYAGIGDWMVFAPVLKEIKRLRPAMKIFVVAGRNIEWMLKADPHIDGYSVLPDCSILKENLKIDDKIFISTFVGFLNLTQCRLHVLDLTRKLLGLSVSQADCSPVCYIQPEDETMGLSLAKAFKGKMIVICNDTSQQEKRWDTRRWAQVIGRFKRHVFVQIGEVASVPIPGVVRMAGKTSFTQALGIVKHARLFVGVDGVFNHSSRAFGVPRVILWGPHSPLNFAYRDGSVNVWDGVHCRVCSDTPGGHCMRNSKHSLSPCLDAITAGEVVNAIKKQLGEPFDARVRYYEPLKYSSTLCRGCSFRRLCLIDFFAKSLVDLFLWKLAFPDKR